MIRRLLLACICSLLCQYAAAANPPSAGLVLWLDASDAASMTLDEQKRVQAWHDKSGNANDVTLDAGAGSSAVLPTLVSGAMNNQAVVRLGGSAAFLGKTIRAAKGPVTVLMVTRRSSSQAGGKAWQRLFSSRPVVGSNDNVLPNFGISVEKTTAYASTLSFLELSDVPIGPIAVGRNAVGTSEDLRGDIAEVLVYNRAFVSQGERQVAFQYLASKWGVSMPAEASAWTRSGGLGALPATSNANLPLSDQTNAGKWVLDPAFSDDFSKPLDTKRWHVNDGAAGDTLGRMPALFTAQNAVVAAGNLNIYFRKETVPAMAQHPGFAGYTSALVRTVARSGYGYYETRAKPMNSAGSSAFWLNWTGMPNNLTEIDIFEIGGKTAGGAFDRLYNMNAHVWATPTSSEHFSVGSTWTAPWRLASTFHVYGLDWQADTLRWYVDGVLVREAKNTNWFFPMQIIFDSEAMWTWFGQVDDADLPSVFRVDYLKVWRRGQ
jgi:beta-glucanase (GH16 family)